MPTDTKTIGAEIGECSESRENSPKLKINAAAKIKTGSSCMGPTFLSLSGEVDGETRCDRNSLFPGAPHGLPTSLS
jgi:hypothetical protein